MRRYGLLIAMTASTFLSSMVLSAAEPKTVRDAMWIWGHYEGSYNNDWGLPGNSSITPLAGARSMGIPNLILIRYSDKPAPPFDAYAQPLRSLDRVMWSMTGSGGVTSEEERNQVFALAAKMPNMTGVFLDDFFHFKIENGEVKKTLEGGEPLSVQPVPASLSAEQLRQLRSRLNVGGRKLDLGVVVYTNQLDQRIVPHLKHCDIVSLWTWKAEEIANLEANLAKMKKLAPDKRILLGLYMWDFGLRKPMPVDLMRRQCELALKWLGEGKIEGMIFLATNICDLKIESVYWSRRWITEVGDQPLAAKP